jgi:hypothetical protein
MKVLNVEALNSISLADVSALRVAKSDKTVQVHIERIKKGKFEKSEIGALTKLLSNRFAPQDRKDSVNALKELALECMGSEYLSNGITGEVLHFKRGGAKISKEQTALGKTWLREFFFKKNDEVRGGKNTEGVGTRVLSIAKSVSKFEFVGVLLCYNQYGYSNSCLPIYRTYNRKGDYFDYAPIHWGQPVIMEGY